MPVYDVTRFSMTVFLYILFLCHACGLSLRLLSLLFFIAWLLQQTDSVWSLHVLHKMMDRINKVIYNQCTFSTV